jgi:uncharacterized protein YdhG (YjbR/CyaY superfamily)
LPGGKPSSKARKTAMNKFKSVDEYLSASQEEARKRLKELRRIIRQAAPHAEEVISYNMPAVKWNGMLVWYAAFKKHIGFYPMASAIAAFKQDLKHYKTSKGAIQFPMDEPIPAGVVKKIVKFRLREHEQGRK